MLRNFRRSSSRRTRRHLWRDRRGASATEFAIVAPVLILMIGAFFSLAAFLRAKSTIDTYAREAARGVAVGYMSVAEARQFAESKARGDLNVTVTATVDPATRGDPGDPDVLVTLEISAAEMARLTPFVNGITGRLSSTVTMRHIAP